MNNKDFKRHQIDSKNYQAIEYLINSYGNTSAIISSYKPHQYLVYNDYYKYSHRLRIKDKYSKKTRYIKYTDDESIYDILDRITTLINK